MFSISPRNNPQSAFKKNKQSLYLFIEYVCIVKMYIRWVNVTPIFDKYEQNNP